MASIRLTLEEVEELSLTAFTSCGALPQNALPVADSIRSAEADGIRNVGLGYLSHYCEHLLCGKVDGKVTPSLQQLTVAAFECDARNGFAHSAFMHALETFAQCAPETGVSALSIQHSYAAGVIGWYVEKLAERGLVALAFANSPPAIAPWGGTKAFFGTNPLAFAVPRRDKPPMVIDQSSSTTAKVNVVNAANRGEPIPDNWTFDKFGKPTTDAKEGLAGSMTPSGGYKGVALAMIVDLLAGAVTGSTMSHRAASFGDNTRGFPDVGQFFLAIDPNHFSSNFSDRAEDMLTAMLQQEGVRLPGDRRLISRANTARDGIELPESLYHKLMKYCDR